MNRSHIWKLQMLLRLNASCCYKLKRGHVEKRLNIKASMAVILKPFVSAKCAEFCLLCPLTAEFCSGHVQQLLLMSANDFHQPQLR